MIKINNNGNSVIETVVILINNEQIKYKNTIKYICNLRIVNFKLLTFFI